MLGQNHDTIKLTAVDSGAKHVQRPSRRRRLVSVLADSHGTQSQTNKWPLVVSAKHATAMAAAGAVLGPLCDGQHSRHMVLEYSNPIMIRLQPSDWELQTCW